MKKHTQFLTIFLIGIFFSSLGLAQSDQPEGASFQFDIPQNIQLLQQQIKLAEDNEDLDAYYFLRQQIIEAWQQVNPEVAKFYNTVPSDGLIHSSDGAPSGSERTFNTLEPNIDSEIPMESPLWLLDKQVTDGQAYDLSMDVAVNGDIYIAVLGRLDGSTTKDSVYVYKSTNGGDSWALWSSIYATTLAFDQVELMCFDFGASDNYILLFFRFDNGMLRVGRRSLDTPAGWNYYTIVSTGVLDFAVDRNYSGTKRAFCVYDSSNYIRSVRSDPASFGSVWQDVSPVGQSQLVGKNDLDMAYGWNGAIYATFNGFISGNLYVDENVNYFDPTSWQSRHTIAQGNVDTTRHAEIIASREDDPNNQVVVLFERKNGNTYGIYDAQRDNGTWGAYTGWVTVTENKWPSLYVSPKITGNKLFRGTFEQSEVGNVAPRSIKYKGFTGTTWTTSLQISDVTNDVTGLQKPEIADIDGNTPIIAYVGGNWQGVYFDNSSWVTDVRTEPGIPERYSLDQNYPNPFNPNTSIRFSIPQQDNVVLKIFNNIGQEVSTIVNQAMDAGNYEVNFNAADLASGVYFYRIQTGNFSESKKMIMIK